MENKWLNIGKDRIMAGYVKTNDIFKDMRGIMSPHKEPRIRRSTQLLSAEIGCWDTELPVKKCRAKTGLNMALKL